MATQGESGWQRFVFGSVAEKVVRHSDWPVLTIRAPDQEEE
jgi:nucleotide-binding universal stress UspA family protein